MGSGPKRKRATETAFDAAERDGRDCRLRTGHRGGVWHDVGTLDSRRPNDDVTEGADVRGGTPRRIMSESLVELRDENGVFVARFNEPDLDNLKGAELADELLVLVSQIGSGCVVLDLSAVRFIQTRGIGAALLIHKEVAAAGGKVCVCVSDHSVRQPFKVAKLDSVLEIHDDLETAIRSMRGG